MTDRPLLFGAAAAVLFVAAGCTPAMNSPIDSGTTPPVDAHSDAMAASDVSITAEGGVGGATGATLFGIAVRPTNQTCKPPENMFLPADKLSATGCTDPNDTKKPAASLIPYDVASPLWSDGADKQRFLALPDGAKVHVKNCATEPDTCKPASQGGTSPDEGHWVLPVGTVFVKTFSFGGRPVETRLFVRFPNQDPQMDLWGGYSYQWNADQTDAVLVSEYGDTAPITTGAVVPGQTWTFPSRNQCLECHNQAAGWSLGPDTRQLNWSFRYPSGVVSNQVATLEHIGVFDRAVVPLPPLADFRDSKIANDDRTRSYLHSNCATCHRPNGNYSAIDLRVGVALKDMTVCNIAPNKGDFGVVDAKRLVPANPMKSLLLLRMQAIDKDSGRMPQLATSVLDALGIGLVSQWIQGITTCP